MLLSSILKIKTTLEMSMYLVRLASHILCPKVGD